MADRIESQAVESTSNDRAPESARQALFGDTMPPISVSRFIKDNFKVLNPGQDIAVSFRDLEEFKNRPDTSINEARILSTILKHGVAFAGLSNDQWGFEHGVTIKDVEAFEKLALKEPNNEFVKDVANDLIGITPDSLLRDAKIDSDYISAPDVSADVKSRLMLSEAAHLEHLGKTQEASKVYDKLIGAEFSNYSWQAKYEIDSTSRLAKAAFLERQGDKVGAEKLYEQAINLQSIAQMPDVIAPIKSNALIAKAGFMERDSKPDLAAKLYDSAIDAQSGANNSDISLLIKTTGLVAKAGFMERQGNVQQTDICLDQALTARRTANNTNVAASLTSNVMLAKGEILEHRGDVIGAEKAYDDAINASGITNMSDTSALIRSTGLLAKASFKERLERISEADQLFDQAINANSLAFKKDMTAFIWSNATIQKANFFTRQRDDKAASKLLLRANNETYAWSTDMDRSIKSNAKMAQLAFIDGNSSPIQPEGTNGFNSPNTKAKTLKETNNFLYHAMGGTDPSYYLDNSRFWDPAYHFFN